MKYEINFLQPTNVIECDRKSLKLGLYQKTREWGSDISSESPSLE